MLSIQDKHRLNVYVEYLKIGMKYTQKKKFLWAITRKHDMSDWNYSHITV